MEWLPLLIWLPAAGVIAGVISGLLGVGGGIVIVPALYYVFGMTGVDPAVKMHLAVGTSLALIVPTGLSSARAHWKRGAVDVEVLKSWAAPILLGVVAGTVGAGALRGSVLTGLFGMVAMAVAAQLAFAKTYQPIAPHLPQGIGRYALGFCIGGLSTMLGIGGGSFSVPTLTLCGHPIRRAVGTASAVGLLIALPGAIGFIISGWTSTALPVRALGYVDPAALVLIAPITVLCAPLGAAIAHRIDATKLRRLFAVFLFITGGRMLYSLLAG